MQQHRETFTGVVQSIYQEAGVTHRDFAQEWDEVFFHKMLRGQRHEDTIVLLSRGHSTGQD